MHISSYSEKIAREIHIVRSESKQKYQSHGETERLATQSDAIKGERKNGRKSSRVIRPSAYRTAEIPMPDFNEIEATEKKYVQAL